MINSGVLINGLINLIKVKNRPKRGKKAKKEGKNNIDRQVSYAYTGFQEAALGLEGPPRSRIRPYDTETKRKEKRKRGKL